MKLSKFQTIFFFVAALVILAFIAGCTAKTEKPAAQKKPTENVKFQGYAQVAWAPDGKGIFTLERYSEEKLLPTYSVYYQKADLSERDLLRDGLSRLVSNRIAISPDGRYLMYIYAWGIDYDGGFTGVKGAKVFVEIFDVETNKVVNKIQITAATDWFGWRDNTTAWFADTGLSAATTYIIRVGSSQKTKLVKGVGAGWSDDKRYLLYIASTTGLGLHTIGSLYLLDMTTKTSSELLKSVDSATGMWVNNLVVAGNKLYYVRNHADTESFEINVLDLRTKKEKVLWSMANPAGPDIIDRSVFPPIPIEGHPISVDKMFLDRLKRFLVFSVRIGEPQASVYKLAVGGKSKAQSITSMQLAAASEAYWFDYSTANNTLLWIEKGKTIKTQKLK